jgi:hypothetical protein
MAKIFAFETLEQMVHDHIDLIEINTVAIQESRQRAAKFLIMQSILNDHLKLLEDVKVRASTAEKATYAQVLLGYAGKKVTEVKILAQGDPNYAQTRESVELIDSEINWTKKHFDIFNNAHIMFRQYSQN